MVLTERHEPCEGCAGSRRLYEVLCVKCIADLPRHLRKRLLRAEERAQRKVNPNEKRLRNNQYKAVQREALEYLTDA